MNSSRERLRFQVSGMDCAACALKIETAVRRMPGVEEVTVNTALQRMTVSSPGPLPAAADIIATVRRLGYGAAIQRPQATHGQDQENPGHAGDACCAGDHGNGRRHGHADEAARPAPALRQRLAAGWAAPPWLPAGAGRLALALAAAALALVAAWLAPGWATHAWSLATLVAVAPIARRAVAAAFAGSPFTIETLLVTAAIGALLIGEAAEAATVVVLFNIGEMLEGVAASRARAGVTALLDVMPRTALRDSPDGPETVDAAELAVGDIVIVRPGDRAPSDGVVIAGASEVNEAPVTGESTPAARSAGDTIWAGVINLAAELRVRITATAADNTIARIIAMVEEAQERKAPIERFINRFSRWYTPAAMAFAALTAILPPLLAGQPWDTWIYRGLAVLLIACPCALVISTPAAIAAAIASGARRGLLVKGGATLETLAHVRTIAFDKTGTLTRGEPRVVAVVALAGPEDAALAKAAAVESGSSHPLGLAIMAEAKARGLAIARTLEGSAASPGLGVSARLESGLVVVGSPRQARGAGALAEAAEAEIARLEGEGATVAVVSENGAALALIALRDEPRDDAAAGLAELKRLGVSPVMLTGDNARAARAIGAALGLEAQAELMPADKLAAIAALPAPAAMVGDGVNDAPALAAAAVGVAMGAGTDVALETADAALLRNRIADVPRLVRLARAAMANIRQNLVIALGLKALFLVTTLAGETPLWMAILADTGATVLVTANALRLLRLKDSAAE